MPILPGVIVRFEENASIEIGAANKPGTLIAQGDKDSNIIFTSNQTSKTKGWWNHIRFTENDFGSSLLHCKLEYGGGYDFWSGRGNVVTSSESTDITNCTITNSKRYGVKVMYSGKPDLTGTSFSGNTNDDIYLYNEESSYKGKPVEPFTVGHNY